MENNYVSLEEMLEGKEVRARYQAQLIEKYKRPLVCFTVVMPGPIKQNEMSEKIFALGKREIENAFKEHNVIFQDERVKKTGSEGYYVVDLPVEELKKTVVKIEDESAIGRLFDIDVIGRDYMPISRSKYGMPERKCLICGGPAHSCARSRKHSVDELLKEIERVLADHRGLPM